jgi:DmsE family decaheme c-type cytochrome
MDMLKKVLYVLALSTIVLSGCETLRSSKPIIPIREYERMIVGRLDADYVGTHNCLSACHFHDKIKQDFDASTMGAQMSTKSGMPLVDCESCHGPGSLAVAGITPEKVAEDAKQGKQTACDYKTLIDLKELPAPAQSLICLKCHSGASVFTLHNWSVSTHAINDVSCFDCHNVHMGPDLTVRRAEMENMCERCHQDVKAEFSMPSHHPVREKKIFCTNCHEPHGSVNEKQLRKPTVKEVCTQCHGEKEGPFLYEHAENTEDCVSCHSPHGSVNNNLLKIAVPFLCMQCHVTHPPLDNASKGTYFTRCTDCHTQIHGTDIPSAFSNKGRFTY